MVGGSNLSINQMGRMGTPCQKLFYLHYKKGINRESNIYVDKPVVLDTTKAGVITPKAELFIDQGLKSKSMFTGIE